MEKSIQIVVVVVVVLATALIIMIIFNKGMGDWMGIFGDWGSRAADESSCRQNCITSCNMGTASYNEGTIDWKGKIRSCSQLLGTECKCGFGLTADNRP
ncbi:MAG: hypothetical protein JW716_00080 [Candidatus Aenigmarchaeota archaeon]|nr:hypothetical protein [Candidatus Aenigmarchaeota archaeon]